MTNLKYVIQKLNYNHKKIKSIELNTKNKIYIDTTDL